MELTIERAKELMANNNGDLDLVRHPVTRLPDGLKVDGSLYMFVTGTTVLPEGLTVGGIIFTYAHTVLQE